jgi:DNA-binding transcriptional regulator YiaG
VFRDAAILIGCAIPPERVLTSGLKCRRSLYDERGGWHRVFSMNELRQLRRHADLSQRDFAGLLDIPLNTFRMWDSGLRPVPAHMLLRARAAFEHQAQQMELLPLSQLAREFHVHVRTLQAAVRTGRLDAHFSVKSVFGRPRRLATRAAAERFMALHYRCFAGQQVCPAPLPTVPNDYDRQLRTLRRRLRLTQDGLARRIGAAGKAVIYQWESRKRTPSPVLWQEVIRLQLVGARTAVSNLGVAPNREPMRAADGHETPPDLTRLRLPSDDVVKPAAPAAALDRL